MGLLAIATKATSAKLVPAHAEPGQQFAGAVWLTHILATVRARFDRLRSLILQVLAVGLGLGLLLGLRNRQLN